MKCVRFTAVVLLVLAAAGPAHAANKATIERAKRFFDDDDRGKFILGYLHFGGQYKDHECVAHGDIVDDNGKTTGFYLRYQFDWALGKYDNTTTVDLNFDAIGRFRTIDSEDSTSIVSPPYSFANGAMKILGQALLEAMRKDLKKEDQKAIQKFIDDADAHAMLQFALDLQYNVLGR